MEWGWNETNGASNWQSFRIALRWLCPLSFKFGQTSSASPARWQSRSKEVRLPLEQEIALPPDPGILERLLPTSGNQLGIWTVPPIGRGPNPRTKAGLAQPRNPVKAWPERKAMRQTLGHAFANRRSFHPIRMKQALVILAVATLAFGCTTALPKGESTGAVAAQPSSLHSISKVLEASGVEGPQGAAEAQPAGPVVPGQATVSENRLIRTVGDLLTDPQFRQVVAALEAVEE